MNNSTDESLVITIDSLATMGIVRSIDEVLENQRRSIEDVLSSPAHQNTLLKVRLLYLETELHDIVQSLHAEAQSMDTQIAILNKSALRSLVRNLDHVIHLLNQMESHLDDDAFNSSAKLNEALINFQAEIRSCLSARDERAARSKLVQTMLEQVPALSRLATFMRTEMLRRGPPPVGSSPYRTSKDTYAPPPALSSPGRAQRTTTSTARASSPPAFGTSSPPPQRHARDTNVAAPPALDDDDYDNRRNDARRYRDEAPSGARARVLSSNDLLQQEASRYSHYQDTMNTLSAAERQLDAMEPRGGAMSPLDTAPPPMEDDNKSQKSNARDNSDNESEKNSPVRTKKRKRSERATSPATSDMDSEEREKGEKGRRKRRRSYRWTRDEEDFLIARLKMYKGNFFNVEWGDIANRALEKNAIRARKNMSTAMRDKCRTLINNKSICDLCFDRINRSDADIFDCTKTICAAANYVCKPGQCKCKAAAHRSCVEKRDRKPTASGDFVCNHCMRYEKIKHDDEREAQEEESGSEAEEQVQSD